MDNPKKAVQICVRITEELNEKIRQEAAIQKRKPANMINVILEDYFESKDRIKKIAERR